MKLAFAALGLLVSAGIRLSAQQPQSLDGKTAEQVYKSIQVLNGTPADQLSQSMHLIKGALGMDCEECHVDGAFDKDDKPLKFVARQMMQMVADLNKKSFGGQQVVTCYTCHHGSRQPSNTPELPLVETRALPQTALPSVALILAKYVEALGGEQAIRKITSRVITGTQYIPTGPGGVVPIPATIERDLKAPNLILNVYRTPAYTTADGFDGTRSWFQNMQGRVTEALAIDQSRAKRTADFYEPLDLKKEYEQIEIAGVELLNGRAVYVLICQPQGDIAERLYFDTLTGLLLRKWTALPTQAGMSPFQIDFDDYRDTGSGVKFPYLITMSPAGNRTELAPTATIRVTKVEDNVPMENAKFTKPQSQPVPR
jgi:hypothetical protein